MFGDNWKVHIFQLCLTPIDRSLASLSLRVPIPVRRAPVKIGKITTIDFRVENIIALPPQIECLYQRIYGYLARASRFLSSDDSDQSISIDPLSKKLTKKRKRGICAGDVSTRTRNICYSQLVVNSCIVRIAREKGSLAMLKKEIVC